MANTGNDWTWTRKKMRNVPSVWKEFEFNLFVNKYL